jgi:hypothetical protein
MTYQAYKYFFVDEIHLAKSIELDEIGGKRQNSSAVNNYFAFKIYAILFFVNPQFEPN